MNPIRQQVIVLALILVGASAGAALLYLNRPEPEQAVVEQKPLLVDVAEVDKQTITVAVRSQGTVSARTRTTLVSEVSGNVVEVSPQFEAGNFFDKGEVLLQIDQRDYRTALKRAEAAVASARSALALEKGRAEVAYRDWLKFSRDVNRTAEAEALAQRKPQLAEAQAQLDSALADLAQARDNLDRTTIRAPYAGMIEEKKVGIGQYVNSGTQLGTLFSVDTAEVRLPIPDNRIGYLNLTDGETPARVTLTADMGDNTHQWEARLVRTEGVFDKSTRVLFAVAEVEDPYGLEKPRDMPLRVGTFVRARIEGRTFDDLVVLPRHVLRTGNRVWVVDSEERLINRQVKLLRTEGELAYVYEGLAEGERVCLSTVPNAVAGTRIRANSTVKTSSLLEPKSARQTSDESARLAVKPPAGEPQG